MILMTLYLVGLIKFVVIAVGIAAVIRIALFIRVADPYNVNSTSTHKFTFIHAVVIAGCIMLLRFLGS